MDRLFDHIVRLCLLESGFLGLNLTRHRQLLRCLLALLVDHGVENDGWPTQKWVGPLVAFLTSCRKQLVEFLLMPKQNIKIQPSQGERHGASRRYSGLEFSKKQVSGENMGLGDQNEKKTINQHPLPRDPNTFSEGDWRHCYVGVEGPITF